MSSSDHVDASSKERQKKERKRVRGIYCCARRIEKEKVMLGIKIPNGNNYVAYSGTQNCLFQLIEGGGAREYQMMQFWC